MTMTEAEKKGYIFTGMVWSKYRADEEAKQKARLEALKAKYKGIDYRIVTDRANSWLGNNCKAVMGNDVFMKVQYYNEEQSKKFIDGYADRVARLEQEYQEKLADLQKKQADAISLYEYVQSIKK